MISYRFIDVESNVQIAQNPIRSTNSTLIPMIQWRPSRARATVLAGFGILAVPSSNRVKCFIVLHLFCRWKANWCHSDSRPLRI